MSQQTVLTSSWREYQEEAAAFFRGLSMTAETDVTLQGVRTTHDIDVVARTDYAGFAILWIIECKCWKTPVTKLHVLGLREIVSDLGADRGILLAEAGFQSGAMEAAHLTNVQLTSLAGLQLPAESQIYSMRVLELFDRAAVCNSRYWAVNKRDRIEFGLRQEVGVFGYSGDRVIELVEDLTKKGMRGSYPVKPDEILRRVFDLPASLSSVRELYDLVLPFVEELEGKLTYVEAALAHRKNPSV